MPHKVFAWLMVMIVCIGFTALGGAVTIAHDRGFADPIAAEISRVAAAVIFWTGLAGVIVSCVAAFIGQHDYWDVQ